VIEAKAETKTLFGIEFMINLIDSYPDVTLEFFQSPACLSKWVWLIRWIEHKIVRSNARPDSQIVRHAQRLRSFAPPGAVEQL
jgi:hypothetical protein